MESFVQIQDPLVRNMQQPEPEAVRPDSRENYTQVNRSKKQVYACLFDPKTGDEMTVFTVFWGCVIVGIGAFTWWGLPKFVDHVIKPTVNYIQVCTLLLMHIQAQEFADQSFLVKQSLHEPAPALILQETWSKGVTSVVVIACLSLAPLVFVTSGPFILLAATVLGFWWGLLIVTVGTTIGMMLPYAVGRKLLHKRLQR